MAVGLYLLSRLDADTPVLADGRWRCSSSASGIGSSMQVLTIVVQSTVAYEDLGVATSGVTFFRTLGSSFGAAVFGTVYANVLHDTAARGGRRVARGRPGRGDDARGAARLPGRADRADRRRLRARRARRVPGRRAGAAGRVRPGAVPQGGAAAWDRPRARPPTSARASGCPRAPTRTSSCSSPSPGCSGTRAAAELPRVREQSGAAFDASDGWAVGQVYLRSPARPDHRPSTRSAAATGCRPRCSNPRSSTPPRARLPRRARRAAAPHRRGRGGDRQDRRRDAGLARGRARRLGRRRGQLANGSGRPRDQVRRADPELTSGPAASRSLPRRS